MRDLGLLLLRVVVGAVLVSHGLPKLVPLWDASPQDTARLFESVGLVPAFPLTIATGLVEALGGGLLIAGAYTFWTTMCLAGTTMALAWKLYLPNGFFLNWELAPGAGHGYEFALVLVAALLCLLLSGPGSFSFDRRRAHVREAAEMGRARLRARKI